MMKKILNIRLSLIYLADKELGKTPLKNQSITPGKYTIRLMPEDKTLAPYETTVSLESAASTVISRSFGETLLDSSGYSLSLIPDKANEATLSIVSDPDTGSLTIDGVPSGFTPLSKRSVSPGNHEVVVGTPGFAEQKISVIAVTGFNLVVSVKLKSEPISLTPPSPSPSSTVVDASSSAQANVLPSSTPTPNPKSSPSSMPSTTPAKPYVTVSNSADVVSAGGLNVRKEPNSSASSLGKADVGEHLKYLGETTSEHLDLAELLAERLPFAIANSLGVDAESRKIGHVVFRMRAVRGGAVLARTQGRPRFAAARGGWLQRKL
jgi:hypothetical protein